jgi:hypothetical protein
MSRKVGFDQFIQISSRIAGNLTTQTLKRYPYLHSSLHQIRLTSTSPQVRSTVATAFKYIVVDPTQSSDDMLKPIVTQLLTLLNDSDIVSARKED